MSSAYRDSRAPLHAYAIRQWADRQDDTLAMSLLAVNLDTSAGAAALLSEQYGGLYDEDRTVSYLTEMSGTQAATVTDGFDRDAFDYDGHGMGFATEAVAFATLEWAKQRPDSWTVTWVHAPGAGSARQVHLDVDGETVPAGDSFSNGWIGPGGPGCRCVLLASRARR